MWTAKTNQTGRMLGARSFCWFCRVAAHFILITQKPNRTYRHILQGKGVGLMWWKKTAVPGGNHQSWMAFIMSHVTRKYVFGVCDQGRLKSACSATEAR